MSKITEQEALQQQNKKLGDPWGYKKWEDLDVETDSDDCHPNIEIGTWRRLKERMRKEKGIKKKELQVRDKWNTTSLNKDNVIDPYKKLDKSNNDDNSNDNMDEKNESINNDNNSDNNVNNNNDNVVPKPESNNDEKTVETNTQTQAQKKPKPKTKSKAKSKPKTTKKNDDIYKARSDPQTFLDRNMELLKEFCQIKSDINANNFIKRHFDIIHEASEGYLITYAVDRAVEGANDKELRRYAKRCLMIHNLVQSCSQANLSPERGVEIFYKRLGTSEQVLQQYERELDIQCNELMERIYERKKERLQEAMQNNEVEYEEIQAPLGPGGLDPTEVLNSLPQEMQDAFINQDIPKLQQVLQSMPETEAEYHMKRCVDAGLWVTNADDEPTTNNDDNTQTTTNNDNNIESNIDTNNNVDSQ